MTFSQSTKVLCLFPKEDTLNIFFNALNEESFIVYKLHDVSATLASIYNEPPDVILISSRIESWKNFLSQLKKDPVYGHLPIIIILQNLDSKALTNNTEQIFCDDFIVENTAPQELLSRISLRLAHSNRYLDANPLTRLPGNVSIIRNIQKFISSQSHFALCYLDIDNFKAFNDHYGFAQGDDMIKMTARIIRNVVRSFSPDKGFVGHVGGDDFVFIVPSDIQETCCQQIIQNFDLVSSTLSSDEDRTKGFFESVDRQGNPQTFPLPSISIAIVDYSLTPFKHPGQAAATAGELKKEVKKKSGSNFMLNRRQLK